MPIHSLEIDTGDIAPINLEQAREARDRGLAAVNAAARGARELLRERDALITLNAQADEQRAVAQDALQTQLEQLDLWFGSEPAADHTEVEMPKELVKSVAAARQLLDAWVRECEERGLQLETAAHQIVRCEATVAQLFKQAVDADLVLMSLEDPVENVAGDAPGQSPCQQAAVMPPVEDLSSDSADVVGLVAWVAEG